LRKAYSYHTVDQVEKKPDGVYRIGRITGGRHTPGPHGPGDLIRDDRDGKFYEVAQVVTLVFPVEVEEVDA
jgi:hypothetical protein